jgi:hypothetical protein
VWLCNDMQMHCIHFVCDSFLLHGDSIWEEQSGGHVPFQDFHWYISFFSFNTWMYFYRNTLPPIMSSCSVTSRSSLCSIEYHDTGELPPGHLWSFAPWRPQGLLNLHLRTLACTKAWLTLGLMWIYFTNLLFLGLEHTLFHFFNLFCTT